MIAAGGREFTWVIDTTQRGTRAGRGDEGACPGMKENALGYGVNARRRMMTGESPESEGQRVGVTAEMRGVSSMSIARWGWCAVWLPQTSRRDEGVR